MTGGRSPSDAAIIRQRLDDLARDVERSRRPDGQGRVVVVVQLTKPAGTVWATVQASQTYPCQVVDITGPDTPGSVATFTPRGPVLTATNLRGGKPPDPTAGTPTRHICTTVKGVLVFEYGA